MNNVKTTKTEFVIPAEYVAPCGSPEHDAPLMVYVPPGQCLKHRCPKCGVEQFVLNSVDTYMNGGN